MPSGQEIERKFLLKRFPSELTPAHEAISAYQGYLSTSPHYEVRISNRLHLTTKMGIGLSREENIENISQEVLDMLWPLTLGKRIHKKRHFFTVGDYLAEVDIYGAENTGLTVVEVEFPTEAESILFNPPDWFGRDVTLEGKYKNAQLAR